MIKPLSICIPSNRNFNRAKASIFSAISFCENNQTNLIISDNANDQDKTKILKNIDLPFVKYLFNGPDIAIENWLNAVKESSSLYTLILSDDDLILNVEDNKIDFKELKKNNILGIKPVINCWNSSVGVYKTNNFKIDQDDPIERVINYRKNSSGDNTSMYSFFDTQVLKDLLTVFLYHPTRGGYTDWAFTHALISSGKLVNDYSKLLVYKNNNWFGDASHIISQTKELFTKSGLNERGILFNMLFRALDIFILVLRYNSPLNRLLLIETAKFSFKFYMKNFKEYFLKHIKNFTPNEASAIEKINMNGTVEAMLEQSLEVINVYFPGLKEKYQNFYLKTVGYEWGIIK